MWNSLRHPVSSQSFYLFYRLVGCSYQEKAYMRSNGLQMKIFYVFKYLSDIYLFRSWYFCQMYELILMYVFIWSKLCCNFNVSSTKLTHMLNILDKFSMGVTFGIRAWLTQIVSWVIKSTIQVVVLFESRMFILIVIFG
jgi:hypothetical protein